MLELMSNPRFQFGVGFLLRKRFTCRRADLSELPGKTATVPAHCQVRLDSEPGPHGSLAEFLFTEKL
jgi:hypothetical protein